MTIEISKTNRGFVVGKFSDAYGANCSIQESSSVEPRIWLGSDDDQQRHHVTGELLSTRMHLSREQVTELLPLMQYFVANGHLPQTNDALNAVCEAAAAIGGNAVGSSTEEHF